MTELAKSGWCSAKDIVNDHGITIFELFEYIKIGLPAYTRDHEAVVDSDYLFNIKKVLLDYFKAKIKQEHQDYHPKKYDIDALAKNEYKIRFDKIFDHPHGIKFLSFNKMLNNTLSEVWTFQFKTTEVTKFFDFVSNKSNTLPLYESIKKEKELLALKMASEILEVSSEEIQNIAADATRGELRNIMIKKREAIRANVKNGENEVDISFFNTLIENREIISDLANNELPFDQLKAQIVLDDLMLWKAQHQTIEPKSLDDNSIITKLNKETADAIQIGFSDFIRLCEVDDPKNWYLNIKVKTDGVWIDPVSDDIYLLPEERATLTDHPKKNLSKPALPFPCSFTDFEKFLEWLGGGIQTYVSEDNLKKFVQRQILSIPVASPEPAAPAVVEPGKEAMTTIPMDEFVEESMKNKVNKDVIVVNLRDLYHMTYLQIGRKLKLDKGYQPAQIDAVKKKVERIYKKAKKNQTSHWDNRDTFS